MGIGGKGIGGLPVPLNSDTNIRAGGGTETAQLGGVIHVDTTQFSSPADTVENDAISYTLPADTLNTDGKIIRVKAWGTTAANANLKTVRLYFGGTAIVLQSTILNNKDWILEGDIIRTGSATEKSIAVGMYVGQTANYLDYQSLSKDTTGAIIIKVTAENGVATAGDIVVEGMIVEVLN